MDNNWQRRLRSLIKRKKDRYGIRQEDIAELAGCTPGALAHWANGRRTPGDLETWERLAKALDSHPCYLIYGIDPPGSGSWDLLQGLSGLSDSDLEIVKATATAVRQQHSPN